MELPHESPIATSTCWELLRSGSFGRVALTLNALLTILPVEYYLAGEELAICLGHYRLNQRTINNTVVGFAADAIDPATRSGWTVQIQGVARLPERIGVPTACGQPHPGQMVHITPEIISGQHLQLCPWTTGLPALATKPPQP